MNTTHPLTHDLNHFIDNLRSAGYHIGTTEYIAAQNVTLALIEQGVPAELDELRLLLGPVLCRSATEQAAFQQHFQAWMKHLESKPDIEMSRSDEVTASQPTSLEKIKSLVDTWFLPTTAIIIVFIFIGGIVSLDADLLEFIPKTFSTDLETSFSTVPWYAWTALLLSLLLLIPWQSLWRRQVQGYLIREAVTQHPELTRLPVKSADKAIFQALRQSAQQLRKHINIPTHRLNIKATVKKTIQAGGWFMPVNGTVKHLPEYLVLIDKVSFRDHQTTLIDVLIKKLQDEGVFIVAYYFDTDPRRCYALQEKEYAVFTLPELVARYPEHYLMIFSDGKGLVNTHTGQLVDWISAFSEWSQRTLLTLEQPQYWGHREKLLAQEADFLIMPANEAGLSALAEQIQTKAHFEQKVQGGLNYFPPYLQDQARRWLEPRKPESALFTELLQQIYHFLGKRGYNWFSACAVYPELHWQLTLYLGEQLNYFSEENLVKLARLPWFRYGRMPDWLREQLIAHLSLEERDKIHQVLKSWLLPEKGEPKDFIEVASEIPARSRRHSPLKEYVFLSFMAESWAMKAPEKVVQFVGGSPNLLKIYISRLRDWWSSINVGWVGAKRKPTITFFRARLKNGSEGPEMVIIPAGTFRMSDIQGTGDDDEKPVHEVSVKSFAMGRYPVTVGKFRQFVEATGYETEAEKGDGAWIWSEGEYKKDANWRNPYFPQEDNQPVVCISWNDAMAYIEWLNQETGKQYRLPTEAEWEYAARAGTETDYWWGNEIGTNRANCDDSGSQWSNKQTSPVGSFAPNPFGLYDTVGNVWEWCADPWHENYEEAPTDGSVWKGDDES